MGESWNWAKDNFGVFLETFNEVMDSDLEVFGFGAQENLKLKCVHIVNFVFQDLKAPVKKRDAWWDEYGWMLKQFSTNFFKCLAMPLPATTPLLPAKRKNEEKIFTYGNYLSNVDLNYIFGYEY